MGFCKRAGWTVLVALALVAAASADGGPGRPATTLCLSGTDPYEAVRCFVPNDPLYGYQWHLDNLLGYPDINVAGAWLRGLTGQGVVIGFVDDCLETAHPDLAPNYVAAHSWDFGQNDADPNPVYGDDEHGVSTSGLAGARGGNGVGVTGVAPLAGLAGLRIDFPNQTEQMFIDATLYHATGPDPAIRVKSHSYGLWVGYYPQPGHIAAIQATAAAGVTHVTAAGNERYWHEYGYFDVNGNGTFDPDIDVAVDADANKKHLQNVQETIAVTALAADGKFAYYTNWGACVFATAPSSGALSLAIATTDRTGALGYNAGGDPIGDADYTSQFGGTSACAPQVAGVVALGLEVCPAMDVRMAKHLLARTSRVVDPADASDTSDGGWHTNAAGYHFNQNYGFGLVDADAFTQEAALWTGVSPLVTETTGLVAVGEAITGAGGVWRNFVLSVPGALEEVEVYLDITHAWRGDLEAYLTSPSGTTSRLMYANWLDSFDVIDWTFVTNAFWGEDPLGTWRLELIDTYEWGDDGTWNAFEVLAKTGHLVPEPATLVLLALGAAGFLLRRRR